MTTEARSLSNLLEDIHDKYDKIPASKRQQLVDAYEPAVDVLQELDKLLAHYNGLNTKSKRAWDRLKWDPETSRTLRQRLTSSVTMLNTFYTSLIHDSQVLILEALERLERDYRGGHREESMASIERITSGSVQQEEDDDDAAWTQILRDLEDVGVLRREALSYREMIVDWLMAAVNQGRLLEQSQEADGGMQDSIQDLGTELMSLDIDDELRAHESNLQPPVQSDQSSQSAPLSAPSYPSSSHAQQNPGSLSGFPPLSFPVLTQSSASLGVSSHASDTDNSSLYSHQRALPISNTSMPNTHGTQHADVQASSLSHGQLQTAPISTAASCYPAVVPSDPSETTFPVSNSQSEAPPAYYERGSSIPIDTKWTAHQAMASWNRRDFNDCEKHLEDLLAAVEYGQTVAPNSQPDRRLLRHMIGVCASFGGDFPKAKRFFESVFNGVFLDLGRLDDGDIASAHWLGDVCLHLREHHNALLAYSVAFEGSIGHYGAAQERTRRLCSEVQLLDHWLYGFRRVEHSFTQNLDPTDIFSSTHVMAKSNLLSKVQTRLYEENQFSYVQAPPTAQWYQPLVRVPLRPHVDLTVSEGFLSGPLISLSSWPLPWDPTFSPMDAVQLERAMNRVRNAWKILPLVERVLPTRTLVESKKLHYVTKRGQVWLIEAVKKGLQDIGIEFTEHAFEGSIICCLSQHHDGFTFREGISICFRKLQFRNIYGIKITDVEWATRRFTTNIPRVSETNVDTTDFRNIIRGILEKAELNPADTVLETEATSANATANTYSSFNPLRSFSKRPTYG